MNKKVDLNMEVFKTLYKENKEFLVPVFVIFISIILIVFFVIPQFNAYILKQGQIQTENLKLENLNRSLSVINSTTDGVLNRDVSISSSALPPNKNFALILTAISSAASSSNVSLGDFEFSIGDITAAQAGLGGSSPNMKISLNVSGDSQAIIKFLNTISSSAPVAQIDSVKSTDNFSAIDILFYYKPFPPENLTTPDNISPISSTGQNLLDNINIPNSLTSDTFQGVPTSTASAQ